MTQRRPDVVLLDLVLPDGNGMDLFQDVESRAVTEIIMITGHASLETSIQALRLGAADYLVKPVNIKQLKAVLSRVARPSDLKAEIFTLRNELRSLGRFGPLAGHFGRHAAGLRPDRAGGPNPGHGADYRRERDRQGAGGADPAQAQSPAQTNLFADQLRRHLTTTDRKRNVRP